jgi:broad specificity phosphatase PhoE
MLRARATAVPIAARLGLTPTTIDDLREMDFGRFEGRSFEEIHRLDPQFVERLADVHDDNLKWPEGERRGAFYERVWRAFGQVVDEQPGRRVVVVAHGGVIGAFMAMLRGQLPGDPAIYGPEELQRHASGRTGATHRSAQVQLRGPPGRSR